MNNWIKVSLAPLLILQSIVHRYISSRKGVALKAFPSNNSVLIAKACDDIFYQYLRKDVRDNYSGFQIFGEVEGIQRGIMPDFSISLMHTLGSKHIILKLGEEKSNLENWKTLAPK